MSVMRATRPPEDGPPLTVQIERETRGLVREEFVAARRVLPLAARLPLQTVEGDDRGVEQINWAVKRVAGVSALEIDNLVTDLQGLRDFLSTEADRVQRQLAGYVHLSDAAMKSTKIIADSMSQWRDAIDGGPGGTDLSASQPHPVPDETKETCIS